jgi:hypothetical protein
LRSKKPTPGLVVAIVALSVAMSGSAVAASLVTGKQIKNGSITKKDISKGTLRQLQGFDGEKGDVGPTGPQGPQGLPGAGGPAGPTSLANIVIAQASTTLCAGETQCSIDSVEALCPAGTKPLGGGVFTLALNGTFIGSISTARGYIAAADNYGSGQSAELSAFAYCSKDVASLTFPDGTVSRAAIDRTDVAAMLDAKRAQRRR